MEIKPVAGLQEVADTGVRLPVQARRITPPLCGVCGKELTAADKSSDGLLDDGGVAYRMANILSSAEHNNVMLTGEPGTGKSASVRLLGRRMAEGKIKELASKRIFEINLDLLFNGCYTISDQGEKLRLLFKEAEGNDIILFVDEGHRIYGAGESNSVGNIVKPYITSGSIRLILATTNMEYEMFIAKDAALARRFERIRLKEPDAERTAEIIRTVFASRYPEMTIQDGTVKSLISLTDRYVQDNWQQLTDALAAAKEAAADGDALQGDVEEASDALLNAILAQRYKADKDNLQSLVDSLKNLDLTQYTEESVAVFSNALESAKAVFANADLSVDDQAEIDNAVAALRSAKDGLVAKSETPDPENPDPEKPGGDTGNTGNNGSNSNNGSNNAGSNNSSTANKAAKTGDTAPIAGLMMLVIFSGAAAVVVSKKRAR